MVDSSLFQDFIAETGEHLEETERNLLRLEQNPGDQELLNEIFRSIHTIKGSSEYLGMERIAELSHKLESLLDLLRKAERSIDGAVVDLLIATNDRIGVLIQDLEQHQAERATIDDLVSRIEAYLGPVEGAEAAEQMDTAVEADSEQYADEYDEELFNIFIDQLKEGLQALQAETAQLQSGESPAAALERCADRLTTLRSSANYMGYEQLKGLYEKWSETVADTAQRVADGQEVDLGGFVQDVMAANIARVVGFFPKVEALRQLIPISEPGAPKKQKSDESNAASAFTFDDISAAMENKVQVSNDTQPELGLFSEDEETPLEAPTHQDQGLLKDFIAETGEHLEETERNLLRLEQNPGDQELLNEIFRSIHTIKGSSEYLGMERIAELSHKLESLLDLLRKAERSIDGAVVDLLIATNDRIGVLIQDLEQHQAERATIDDLVSRIEAYLGPVEGAEAAEQMDTAVEADSEQYADEYDEELFNIFIDQLKEGLQALQAETAQLQSGESPAAALERCADRLTTLRSSANYMGYEQLKGLYEKWSETVADTAQRVADGQEVDLGGFVQDVMAANIARVVGFFPKVEALRQEAPAEKPIDEPMPAIEPSAEPAAQEMPEAADQGLLSDFIAEAGEHLEETERNLLRLEQNPEDQALVNEIFRSIHTIKGSSEYLGMTRIAELSHKLESLLDLLRKAERSIDGPVVDLLIAANDRIAALVEDLEHNKGESAQIDDLISQIEGLIEKEAPEQEAPAPVESVAYSALDSGKVYREAYDQELFSIFLQQLNNCLQTLEDETGHLPGGQATQDALDRCLDNVKKLHSSANYMEYDELKAVLEKWMQEIMGARRQVSSAEKVDLEAFSRDVMTGFIKGVKSFFPNLTPGEESQPDFEELPSIVSTPAVEDFAQPDAQEELQPSDLGGAGIDLPVEEAESDVQDEDALEDDSLLSQLASAFDAKMDPLNGPKDQALPRDIESELLSEEGPFSAPLAPAYDAHEIMAQPEDGSKEPGLMEAFLFEEESAPVEKVPRLTAIPKPLADKTQDTESIPIPDREPDDRRSNYRLGRRQTDKFSERLVKHSIRVDAAKIDALMNQVGELVVSRAGFTQLFSQMREFQLQLKQTQKLDQREMQQVKELTNRISEATVSLGRVTAELQENVMKVRMLPIAQLFSRYPRLVHDLVRSLNKKVQLDIRGEETELDKMVIEQIADPIVHIIRNAVDHGIEDISERQRKGKPEAGTLCLEAYHESNYVVIEISDDGRGIDTAQIKARALEKGFVTDEELEEMSESEIVGLIMRPGFSTADEVTHTSGRGVGMDVVKDNIEKLNGTIDIIGNPGAGARFRIKIPLTLAIIPALMVRVADEIFTIPLSTVDETIRIRRDQISTLEGLEVYYLRDATIPLIRLDEVFKMQNEGSHTLEQFVVIVNTGARRVGFIVDELKGREEVVIKPLEDYLQERSGFSGATILGDGGISLILDVFELVNLSVDQHAKRIKADAI